MVRVLPAVLGWSMQADGLPAPLHFATLEAAIAAGWYYARKERVELEICREDGTVRLRSTGTQDAPIGSALKDNAVRNDHHPCPGVES
jgi:hypothetical protein